MEVMAGSTSASPYSSYHPSPCASYNPSPCPSIPPSPGRSSSYAANANGNADPSSLIPWLKNLSSSYTSAASAPKLPHQLFIHTGSISAPVTPPLSSPTARTPRFRTEWDDSNAAPSSGEANNPFLPSSSPSSPGRPISPESSWFAGLQIHSGGPSSPTFNLVSPNPFGLKGEVIAGGGSRTWTPGQSGTCSPAVPGLPSHSDVHMVDGADEFAFGSNPTKLVKPWEGEMIHEECVSDDLELTLGSSHTR